MPAIRTNAAAGMLGVSPSTLRSWERRFGYPEPARTSGGHRQYDLAEVRALRDALAETRNISSAVALARERGEAPASDARLRDAWAAFDEEAADRLLEQSLAVRSVERTIVELLLPAVDELAADGKTAPSAEHELAWRHATGWIAAMRRLAPPAMREEGVLVLEATTPGDPEALQTQALELALRRAGLRTLLLSDAIDPARLGRAVRALEPSLLVLAGRRASLDAAGRLVFAVRRAGSQVRVLDFGGALPAAGGSTVRRLAPDPLAARDEILELLRAGAPADARRRAR